MYNNNFEEGHMNTQEKECYEIITFGEENYPTKKEDIPFDFMYQNVCCLYNPQPAPPVIEISRIGSVKLCEGLIIDVYGDVNNVWFLGSDVARMIDYKQFKNGSYDVNDMVKNMEPYMVAEFRVVNLDTALSGNSTGTSFNTNRIFINEHGLYSKLASSRKPEAKEYSKMIYDTLSKIRRRTGQLAFTENTFDRYEKINNLFTDSRISKKKINNYIFDELGITFENDFEFFKFLEDAGFVKLNDKGLVIDYDNKLIHCVKTDFGDGNIFYIPDQFKYDGVIKMDQYISSLQFSE